MRVPRSVLVSLLSFGLIFASCGKKGDPFVPSRETVGRVTGLEGRWTGEDVLLTGRVADPSKVRKREGVRLYYAVYPQDDPPCDGCPITYEGYESFESEVITGESVSLKAPGIRRGNIYFFEIRLIGPEGEPGPPSNMVRVEAPGGD